MTQDSPVSYAQWGEDFFADAISQERVLGAVNTIAGQPIEFGPIGVGPGRVAKVRASGKIGEAAANRLSTKQTEGLISYRVTLPVELDFEVDLQVDTHRFEAQLLVPLTLTAVALSGVRIHIEATPPRAAEVQVDVTASGLRASVLQRVAGVEGEVKQFVTKYVARELEKPHVLKARTIDVSKAIDAAWASIGPRDETDAEGSSGAGSPGSGTGEDYGADHGADDSGKRLGKEGDPASERAEELG